jgi:hypothetical protein
VCVLPEILARNASFLLRMFTSVYEIMKENLRACYMIFESILDQEAILEV